MRNVIVVCLLALVACSGAQKREALNTARDGVKVAYEATNAARDVFVQWDDQHQADIVAKATSEEDGDARLTAYQAKAQVVWHAFIVAYNALGAASAAIAAATEDDAIQVALLTKEALEAVLKVKKAIEVLKGDVP